MNKTQRMLYSDKQRRLDNLTAENAELRAKLAEYSDVHPDKETRARLAREELQTRKEYSRAVKAYDETRAALSALLPLAESLYETARGDEWDEDDAEFGADADTAIEQARAILAKYSGKGADNG